MIRLCSHPQPLNCECADICFYWTLCEILIVASVVLSVFLDLCRYLLSLHTTIDKYVEMQEALWLSPKMFSSLWQHTYTPGMYSCACTVQVSNHIPLSIPSYRQQGLPKYLPEKDILSGF